MDQEPEGQDRQGNEDSSPAPELPEADLEIVDTLQEGEDPNIQRERHSNLRSSLDDV